MKSMSRFFFTLALVAAVAWLMPLHARADVYNGEEVVVNVGADSKPLDAHERVRMSVLTAAFWVPRADIFKAFGYAGLTLKPTRLISLFPSVGFATNRTSGNGTAFLVSLAVTFKPVDAKIVLYMQSNGYFAPAHAEYYGFYKLQFLPPQTAPLSFGAQCGQLNTTFGSAQTSRSTLVPWSWHPVVCERDLYGRSHDPLPASISF